MLSLLLMLILKLILLLTLVDFKIHVNIRVSHDANLGARSSLFITNTTENRNCDADINRNTSIYTSMDVCNTKAIQLTKYNYNCQYNTKTFTNMSTNTTVESSCQYNTKTFSGMLLKILFYCLPFLKYGITFSKMRLIVQGWDNFTY